MLKFLKWFALVLLTIATLSLLIGFLYQLVGARADHRLKNAPPGKMVEVQGANVHLYCTGAGDITILLEAGGLSFSANWALLQDELSDRYRVCSYDRPGLGFSEELEGYDINNSTLPFRLLEQNGESAPYVLVGHSLGAVLIRRLAALEPNSVAGLVFIDAGPPGPYSNLPESMRSYFEEGERASNLLPTFARFGLLRLTFDPDDLGPDFPAVKGALIEAFYSDPGHIAAGASEFRRADDLAIGSEGLRSTSVPVLSVIGRYDHNDIEGHREAGLAYHRQLANLSSNFSKLAEFEGTGHFDFLGDKQTVVRLRREVDMLLIEVESGS